MALFNTIPVESETLLAKEPKPTSTKRLVGGGIAAAFALGIIAATALSATTAPVPPAALHKKNSNSGSGNYEIYVACLTKDDEQLWSTDDGAIGEGGVSYNVGSYPKFGNDDSWGAGFDYVEIQQFTLDTIWASDCDHFGLAVKGPEGQGYRAYDSDGNWLGSMDALESVHIPNVNINEPNDEGPMALKTSVFLENDGDRPAMVQGNRLLVVSINFKPTMPKPEGWHCIIDEDVTSDGFVMDGHIKSSGKGCELMPPTYYCDADNNILYYQGSLNAMADGSPIDVEFRNGATLEVPINNMQFTYYLDTSNPKCADLCAWANQNEFSGSINLDDDCYADIEMYSVNQNGLGPVKIYGDGVMSPNGVWANADENWPDWINNHWAQSGVGKNLGGDDRALKANEWFMLGGIIDIMQDNSDYFASDGYGLEVRDITIANTMPRGDSAVNHQSCWHIAEIYGSTPNYDKCKELQEKAPGAMLKNINHVSWLAQADGPNLQARWSKIDTSYLQSADDVIHVSASNFNAYKNVVSTGSAGAAVILGSYNLGLNEQKIEDANVNGVFVARAMRLMNGKKSDFGKAIGLVDTMTCMPMVTLEVSAHVDNLVFANLGPDDSGSPVQQLDRWYSIQALEDGGPSCSCKDCKNYTPKFDISLKDWNPDGKANDQSKVCYAKGANWKIDVDSELWANTDDSC